METFVDWFHVRSVNWAPQSNVKWKIVVQLRCFISFIAFTFGLYQMQFSGDADCFDKIYGDYLSKQDKIYLWIVLALYALDPFVCYFAIPATWMNFFVIFSHLYGGLGLVLRRFFGWRYKKVINIKAMLGFEIGVDVWQACDYAYMATHRLV